LKKKDIYLLTIILATNCLTYFFLIPYSQKTANSHMNSGPFFGTTYFILSAIALFLAINISIKHKNIKLFFIFIGLVVTFIYWGYKLHSIYCQGCANSG
jgi:hypothetical protein